jgi:hypothetical protein
MQKGIQYFVETPILIYCCLFLPLQVNDAIAVEATGYALLTLFLVEGGGVTILQDQIVEWLNTMRMGNGGFISTVDTIVAMEALVRYSYNSRIKGRDPLFCGAGAASRNTVLLFFSLKRLSATSPTKASRHHLFFIYLFII